MKRAVVVGAGIVGLSTALYLQKKERHVTLVDPLPPGEGASYGNAGIISVGSVHPESTPGIWREIPGMLFRAPAPVRLRPAYLLPFLPWLMRFLMNSRQTRYLQSAVAMHALSSQAMEYLEPLVREAGAEQWIKRQGSLYVYGERHQFDRALQQNGLRQRLGVHCQVLRGGEVNEAEPALAAGLAGALLVPGACHTVSPVKLSRSLFELFLRRGGNFLQTRVTHFQRQGWRVVQFEAAGNRVSDEVFITAGAYSKDLARLLGSSMPLDTERGYHVVMPEPGVSLARPILFPPQGFAATSMADGLRLAGTVEFAGLQADPDYRRTGLMVQAARRFLPELIGQGEQPWMGYRPSLPDSLPVISRSPRLDNVYFGFGHGHLGLTMAAVTGATLAAMAAEEAPPVDTTPYRIDRRY